MVRITLFSAIMATFAIVAVTATAAEADAAKPPIQTLSKGVSEDLDDEGKPMQYINSVFGDEDDDDYTPEQLEQRSVMRRTKHHHKHSRKHKSKTSSRKLFTVGPASSDSLWSNNVQITWYASHDLQNPQCGNGGGSWQPENSSHIGAVVKGWTDGPQCGEFVKLCNKDANNHCVQVRVIDKCAGCGENHVDLTKSAFKKLSPSGSLTEGRIHGLQMYRSGQKPNPWDIALFGPKLLQG
ncbi:hypothetical protein PHSY_003928 [Pseudozyma hubeiensis SY62]|uniref:RlpA-like protein double-psi beta-barrel domain-containing protein n=1 Tax=Pseudozyma hubeiensis (strain SY62) TaxID=1305764 RepID=R9P4K9_PSEHS|nr:hypothetical protein PHSY_003928 [Pseudozyma hubeiensis SY62]GAC96348.1 hypothetical protein PHSY_003928 [Pseudozyma hubeiensis SY62]